MRPSTPDIAAPRDFRAVRRDVPGALYDPLLSAVVAVEKLKKVNAFVGFTRIDALDRIDDAAARVAPSARIAGPLGARDRGPGRGHLSAVRRGASSRAWEQQVLQSAGLGGVPQTRTAATSNGAPARQPEDIDPDSPLARPALLGDPHAVARADPRSGDVQRLRLGKPDRADLRLAGDERPRVPRRDC